VPQSLGAIPRLEDEPATRARLLLASRSPRRRELLARAGIPHEVIETGVDDGELVPGDCDPGTWVTALAFLKASAGRDRALDAKIPFDLVLGADTVCVSDRGAIWGQPRSESHARATLLELAGSTHEVLTGCALLGPDPRRQRLLLLRRATVRFHDIGPAQIDPYIATGAWRGKAGGYNLYERQHDGWEISVEGDPGCVVGLPMDTLQPALLEVTASWFTPESDPVNAPGAAEDEGGKP